MFGNRIPLHTASREWLSNRKKLSNIDAMRFNALACSLRNIGVQFDPPGRVSPQTRVQASVTICTECGTPFIRRRFRRHETCSVACGARQRWKAEKCPDAAD